jgi:hypothetical protein
MLSFRAHGLICLGLLVALIAVAAGGNLLAASRMIKDPAAIRLPGLIAVFGLFLAFGFSAIPVMVMSVLGAHKRIGQGEAEPIKGLIAAQTVIIWVLWAILAAGLLVALPAMMHDGFFSPEGPNWEAAASPEAAPPEP